MIGDATETFAGDTFTGDDILTGDDLMGDVFLGDGERTTKGEDGASNGD